MRRRKARLCGLVIGLCALMAGSLLWARQGRPSPPAAVARPPPSGGPIDWSALPRNRWVQIHELGDRTWRRQAHAGIAYDSRRGRLVIFGSDTHGTDWDNSVHVYDPATNRWERLGESAPKGTYRADSGGRAVCGPGAPLPWAMHTFDNIAYDPTVDALVVTAVPDHNPIRSQVQGVTIHPTWLYRFGERRWEILENGGNRPPNFFAGGSAYDAGRDTVVAYGKPGVWELGPDRDVWRQATKKRHHEIHFMMEYDEARGLLAVFGNYGGSNAVWIYRPGPKAGEPGNWERREPGGDPVPKDEHFPVAYHPKLQQFLLVVDERVEKGKAPERALTFAYDPDTNRYSRIAGAEFPAQGMNYMMVYDPPRDAFLLVTGDGREPVRVWALRLGS